jgi:multidrug transporter EmrE-like cation transporter
MTPSTFGAIFIGVLLNAGAQLLLKAGVIPLGVIEFKLAGILPLAWRVATQWQIIAGLACYVVSVVVWIGALSRVDVSLAYPMLSLGYVVNAVAAAWLFGEVISLNRMGGMALILVGVYLMSRH